MKKIIILLIIVLSTQFGYGQQTANQSVQSYIEFLKKPHLSPVDYVMSLFERYDVVVIGERGHSEMTQYDFICELITSPAFIEKVGHVMTEVGSNNYTADINRVLGGEYRSDEAFQKDLVGVLRECEQQVLWPRTNWWRLMQTIYKKNRTLPKDKHIDLTMLNPAWVWPNDGEITSEQFDVMCTAIDRGNYDVIMAENAINALYEIFKGPRGKALIIENVPHHLKGYKRWPGTVMACVSARFPDRIANVKLNNVLFCYDPDEDFREYYLPPADGRWDAAFAVTGNKPIGFDMTNSPFGKDAFEDYERHLSDVVSELTYEDMYDGYIFYMPVSEMYNGSGIPGLVNEGFLPELMRRYTLCGFSEQEVLDSTEGNIIQFFNETRRYPVMNDSERIEYESTVNKHK